MAKAIFELETAGDLPEPPESTTAVRQLREWCQRQPNKILYTWLSDTGNEQVSWSYRDLEMRADAVCDALRHQWGCKPGDRAALMYLPGLDFIAAFWGCLFAGVIAVPMYPVDLRKFELEVERFGRIVAACEPKLVLSHREYLRKKWLHAVKNIFGSASWPDGLQFEATDELTPRADSETGYQPSAHELAFLQFTSGSTGDPKGVMLSHGNLAHNVWMISRELGTRPEHIGVSWVPQYHDMGLIGVLLQCPHAGAHSVLLSPLTMLRSPLVWLEACSRYKAHQTCGMDGLYAHAVKKIQESDAAQLDLSALCVYMSGGEPVRAQTVEAFAAKFQKCGLRRGACYPCLGMAENAVYVTGRGPELRTPTILRASTADLGRNVVTVTVHSMSEEPYCELVSCGTPGQGVGIRIVDQESAAELEADRVGEIWVSGPSKAQGYWGKPELSEETFGAKLDGVEYLRTGDLGFLHDGELYVCGRLKDLIIVRGRNQYPQDIERTAEASHAAFRPGCSAAFGVEIDGTEHLVLIAEFKGNPSNQACQDAIQAAKAKVLDAHQLRCYAMLLLKERTVPKTTSGKIRRKACKQGFLDWHDRRQQAATGECTTSHDSTKEMFECIAHWVAESASAIYPQDPSPEKALCADKLPPVDSSEASLKQWVHSRVLEIMQHVLNDQLAAESSLTAAGLDSLKMIEASELVHSQFGFEIPSTLLLDCDTSSAAATCIFDRISTGMANPVPAKAQHVVDMVGVAIVGRASRVAGPLWPSLASATCYLTHTPPSRWNAGGRGTSSGAFLQSIDFFDAAYFGLTELGVAELDFHARLAMEVGTEAVLGSVNLRGVVAVFTAAISHDFGTSMVTCNLPRLLANALKLQGPCYHEEVACTSSHLALHNAREEIVGRSCDAALVVGVTLMLQPVVSRGMLQEGILSPTGVCRPLDQAADGLVRGEACVALVLQALGNSQEHSGIFSRSAVTHNRPRLPSLLSPDQESQESAVRTAQAGCSVELLHIHGIGQLVADATELLALRNTWLPPGTLQNHKANYGHTVAASGLLALLVTLEAFSTRTSSTHLKLMRPTKHLKEPLAPVQETSLVTKTAAVHGHAASGVNVHLVVENCKSSGLHMCMLLSRIWDHKCQPPSGPTAAKAANIPSSRGYKCPFLDNPGLDLTDSAKHTLRRTYDDLHSKGGSRLARICNQIAYGTCNYVPCASSIAECGRSEDRVSWEQLIRCWERSAEAYTTSVDPPVASALDLSHIPGPGGGGDPIGNMHQMTSNWRAFVDENISAYGPVFQLNVQHRPTCIVTSLKDVQVAFDEGQTSKCWFLGQVPVASDLFKGHRISLFENGIAHDRQKCWTLDWLATSSSQSAEVVCNLTDRYVGRWLSLGTLDWVIEVKVYVADLICALLLDIDWPEASSSFDSLFDGIVTPTEQSFEARDTIVAKIRSSKRLFPEGRDEETDEEHVWQSLGTVVLAAYAGMVGALSAVLAELSNDPSVCKKVRTEVLEGGCKAQQHEVASSPTLLNSIIKEVLRLHTPVPFCHVVASQDLTLSGLCIPRGTHIEASIFHSMRDAGIFKDPNRFVPDRFNKKLPDNARKAAELVFGIGGLTGRRCPAQDLVPSSIELAVARIVSRVRWNLVGPKAEFEVAQVKQANAPKRLLVHLIPLPTVALSLSSDLANSVCVVGAGAAGMSAALALSTFGYSVTVLEKQEVVGGHACSFETRDEHDNVVWSTDPAFGGSMSPDTHPNVYALFDLIGVETYKPKQWMLDFSEFVRGSDTTSSPHASEVERFMKAALHMLINQPTTTTTVREFARLHGFEPSTVLGFIVRAFPGEKLSTYLDWPIRIWLESAFRPSRSGDELELIYDQQMVRGGSGSYSESYRLFLEQRGVKFITGCNTKLLQRTNDQCKLNVAIRETGAEYEVECAQLIVATHPDQALEVLASCATSEERSVLAAFDMRGGSATLHRDASWMPEDQTRWAALNRVLPGAEDTPNWSDTLTITRCNPCNLTQQPVFVTYSYGNQLPIHDGVEGPRFSHTQLNCRALELRCQMQALQGSKGAYFAGSYLNGIMSHEDAMVSGLQAANRIMAGRHTYPVIAKWYELHASGEWLKVVPHGGGDHPQSSGTIQGDQAVTTKVHGLVADYLDLSPQHLSMSTVHELVASHLKLDPAAVSLNSTWGELGLTSVQVVQLARAISAEHGLELAPSDFYQHTTIKAMSDQILSLDGNMPIVSTASADDEAELLDLHGSRAQAESPAFYPANQHMTNAAPKEVPSPASCAKESSNTGTEAERRALEQTMIEALALSILGNRIKKSTYEQGLERWPIKLQQGSFLTCPQFLKGLWWMEDNPHAEQLTLIGHDNTCSWCTETSTFQCLRQPSWTYDATSLGVALFNAYEKPHVMQWQFNPELDSCLISYRSMDGSEKRRIVLNTMHRIDDDEWERRLCDRGTKEFVTYRFRRLLKVMADGEVTRTPAYSEFLSQAKERGTISYYEGDAGGRTSKVWEELFKAFPIGGASCTLDLDDLLSAVQAPMLRSAQTARSIFTPLTKAKYMLDKTPAVKIAHKALTSHLAHRRARLDNLQTSSFPTWFSGVWWMDLPETCLLICVDGSEQWDEVTRTLSCSCGRTCMVSSTIPGIALLLSIHSAKGASMEFQFDENCTNAEIRFILPEERPPLHGSSHSIHKAADDHWTWTTRGGTAGHKHQIDMWHVIAHGFAGEVTQLERYPHLLKRAADSYRDGSVEWYALEISGTTVQSAINCKPRLQRRINSDSQKRRWPLSPMQQQMWTLLQLNPDANYNISLVIQLSGKLDSHALSIALQATVAKHDILRTRYMHSEDGSATQQVDASPSTSLFSLASVMDSTVLVPDHKAAEIAVKLANEEKLDLQTAGPLRFHVVQVQSVSTSECWVVLTMHHIACDGMSFSPLMADLASAYSSAVSGRSPELAELPVQYLDWAAWHHATLEWGGERSALEKGLSYWQKTLHDGDLPVLDLADTREVQATKDPPGQVEVQIPESIGGTAAGATPMHVGLACWAASLCRYAGQQAVVVGFPYAHREHQLLLPLVGYFVNTLAAHVTVQPQQGFRSLVTATSKVVLDCLHHGSVPFMRILGSLRHLRRDALHPPVYQNLFLWERGLHKSRLPPMNGLETLGAYAHQPALVQLQLHLSPSNSQTLAWLGHISYDPGLFQRDTVARLGRLLMQLAQAVADRPDVALAALLIIPVREAELVMQRWNATAAVFSTVPAPARFEQITVSRAAATGLLFEGHAVSYGELEWQSTELADQLMRAGYQPAEVVGLCVERSVHEIVGIVGIMRAGQAYVPLDPSQPLVRLACMTGSCDCVAVVVQRRFLAIAEHFARVTVIAGEKWKLHDAEPDTNKGCAGIVSTEVPAEQLAYVLFTSGSTGRPKGVMVQQGSLSAYLAHTSETVGLAPHEGVLHSTAFTFDASVQLVWCPLTSSARLVLANSRSMLNPLHTVHLLSSEVVAFIDLVPSVLAFYLDMCPDKELFPSHVRHVFVLGEACKPSLPTRVLGCGHHLKFTNRYGPAEATIASHGYECYGEEMHGAYHVPIGTTLPNLSCFVQVDSQMLVPVAVAGELQLGGIQLSCGYIARPGTTARSFYNSFWSKQRLYATGDRVRWLANGTLEFLGRVDFQIKLNGQRIEANEVEAVIQSAPGVQHALVLLHKSGVDCLIGYVLPEEIDTDMVIEVCKHNLPAYMVPSQLMAMAAWPLNASGKLDRQRLPDPLGAAVQEIPNDARSQRPPIPTSARALLEDAVLEQVKDLIGHSVGRMQPLMQAGLNSLSAVRLSRKLQGLLSEDAKQLPAILVFQYPNVVAIAEHLDSKTTSYASAQTNQVAPAVASSALVRSCCVVSMQCTAPGKCKAPKSLFSMMLQGYESLQLIPESYIESATGDLYVQHGHFIDHPELFDHLAFDMNALEAKATDPHQRILLETVFGALAAARKAHTIAETPKTGVWLGFGQTGWGSFVHRVNTYTAHAVNAAAACGRISYTLDLKGPCCSIDTACSSSLVAMDAACRGLHGGSCEHAVSAGVNLTFGLGAWTVMCALGALSPDGCCKTFDRRADGYGRGDACSVVVLSNCTSNKVLLSAGASTKQDSRRDCKLVSVEGFSTNQDGRSASFMAPNGLAQQVVIEQALGVLKIGSIEGHGTGTALGDPIEAAALALVHDEDPAPIRSLFGALKSNIGHTEFAAGTSGVVKSVYSLSRGCISPNLHLLGTHPHIQLDELPVCLPSQGSGLPPGGTLGVSSFGFAGTNAHIVLAHKTSALDQEAATLEQPVVLYRQAVYAWWDTKESTISRITADELPVAPRAIWERLWPVSTCGYVAEHRVGGTPVLPGTGYLCLATQARPEAHTAVVGVQFIAILVLDGVLPVLVRVSKAEHTGEMVQRSIEANVGYHGWTEHAVVAVAPVIPINQPKRSAESSGWLALLSPSGTRQQISTSWTLVGRQSGVAASIQGATAVSSEWAMQRVGSGQSSYMQTGRLQDRQTRHHLYHRAWKIDTVTHATRMGTKQRSCVWAPEDTTSQLMSERSTEAVCTTQELCSMLSMGAGGVGVVIWDAGIEPGTLLRSMQAAVLGSASSVWLAVRSEGAGWGLAAAVNAELGSVVRCCLVTEQHPNVQLQVQTATLGSSKDLQLMLGTSGQPRVARLASAPKSIGQSSVQLALSGRGSLSLISIRPQVVQPGAMLKVQAVGLNFRDVLNVLGMYPGDPGPPGGDCAGAMADPSAGRYQQNVFGLAVGSLRSYAPTISRLLAKMPRQWSHAEASTMPTVWVTVWMCLEELVPVVSGCCVLVQAATGGVGLLAVQYAQQAGDRVCATAGRAEKQQFVRELGVSLLSTTRNGAAFSVELESIIGLWCCPLAMVLNSMSHDEYIPEAAGHIGQGGRFVEIGKRGIWPRSKMAAEKQHARYSVVAMDGQSIMDPHWQYRGLEDLDSRAEDGSHPLPMHQYELRSEAAEAFRALQRAGQIGKVVLSLGSAETHIGAADWADSVSVTGGTGGLGLLFGLWLTQRLAGTPVLLSRVGTISRGGEQHWRWLRSSTSAASVELKNVAMFEGLQQLVERGIVGLLHLAGVLADAQFLNQLQSGLQQVWAPKAAAAWNLHQATQQQDGGSRRLDLFVLFSSVATLLGNAGQANYAAANACLDGLARLRQAQGLPSCSVQWGAWAGVGMAVSSGVVERLEAQGLTPITEDLGFRALELNLNAGVVGMVPAKWPVLLMRMEHGENEAPQFLADFATGGRTTEPNVTKRRKLVHFVRHAQAAHNVRFENAKDQDLHLIADDDCFDAELTEQGREQAAQTRMLHADLLAGVDLVVASSLSRTIQTANILLPAHAVRVSLDWLREISGILLHSKRRPRTELARTFSEWDFSELQTEKDELWMADQLEPAGSLLRRGTCALEWIMARPESEVLVVSHGELLRSLLGSRKSSAVQPEHSTSLQLKNSELRSFELTLAENGELDLIPVFTSFAAHRVASAHPTAATGSPDSQRSLEAVEEMVLQKVQEVAGAPVVMHDSLVESGVDSLAATELRSLLQSELGRATKLPSRLAFDYPTAQAIAQFIHAQQETSKTRDCFFSPLTLAHVKEPDTPTIGIPDAVRSARKAVSGVQLLGQACRLPGRIEMPHQLWHALCTGANCIEPRLSSDRKARQPKHQQIQLIAAGFVLDLKVYKHEIMWNSEAQDPIHEDICLLLDCCCASLVDAKLEGAPQGSGVFCAVSTENDVMLQQWAVARVIASQLGVDGPIANIDSGACASGYLAVHRALDNIGHCGHAIVTSSNLIPFSRSMALEPKDMAGLIRPFDSQADGTILSEACCALILGQTKTDGCLIGWAANRTSALLPVGFADPEKMASAAESALSMAGSPPAAEGVRVAHPHGMGNPSTDIPELMALVSVTELAAGPLVLVGHKANLGHTGLASGLVAVTTSALTLQHRVAPSHINIVQSVRAIQNSPSLQLPTAQPMPLPLQGLPMSISGTSISGDNVHLIMNASSQQTVQLLPQEVMLTKQIRGREYTYSPPLQQLQGMTQEELQAVNNFSITREGFGSVAWEEPVDLRSVDCERVQIVRGGVRLDPVELPALDCKCLVTAELMLPTQPNLPLSREEFRNHRHNLKRKVASGGHDWVGYDRCTGQLKFHVQRFQGAAALPSSNLSGILSELVDRINVVKGSVSPKPPTR